MLVKIQISWMTRVVVVVMGGQTAFILVLTIIVATHSLTHLLTKTFTHNLDTHQRLHSTTP